MLLSLRIVALLLLFRLLVLDLETARDLWGWLTVGFDIVLGLVIWLDREPHRRAEEDVRS
ncbi:hypothetical protein AB5J62_33765 [Amycolatopsis sp. cg5]|uniref:hypothetical protein n=1 Tax=Amycolatopsis sp. cg5 TaxID=3238802 RepID=UPI00352366CD